MIFKAIAQIRSYFEDISTLDLRSLGLFRIGLGLVMIYNLCDYLPSWELFFGASGVFPLGENQAPSLHRFSDHFVFIHALWGLHVLCAFLLLVGYKTRLATLLCWIMTVSLFNRAPILGFGGDEILRAALLWGIFLPLGARFSCDEKLKKTKTIISNDYCSIASFAVLVQLIMLYCVNGFCKVDEAWTRDLTALNFVFLDNVAKPWGIALLKYPDLLMILTWLALCLECFGSFLLLLSRRWLFRGLAVILFILFHLCIDLTIKVGWFSWMMIVFWLAMIPRSWWPSKEENAVTLKESRFNFVFVASLLCVIVFANSMYFMNTGIRNSWKKSTFYKMIHAATLDQDILKFTPINKSRTIMMVKPVFSKSLLIDQKTIEKYRFERKPYYRTGKVLNGRVSHKQRLKRYALLKKYLLKSWSVEFPDGPQPKSVEITIIKEKIDPYRNLRQQVSVEKY